MCIVMPLCAPDCDCRWWCKICTMAYHPLFKERVDALIAEHESIVPPKPKRVWREEVD